MKRLELISLKNNLFRPIIFCLTFQIIILLPKVWETDREEQIRQSKGQLELAQVKFKFGLANNFDLIDAETNLRNAQRNLLSAVIDYILSTNQLRASMGTLLERPKKF